LRSGLKDDGGTLILECFTSSVNRFGDDFRTNLSRAPTIGSVWKNDLGSLARNEDTQLTLISLIGSIFTDESRIPCFDLLRDIAKPSSRTTEKTLKESRGTLAALGLPYSKRRE
jgi:hypothetical protein